ncbi:MULTISPECIES: hypothetical protein [Xanthobacter]|uniref:hypothetical protein n=1 Tax=Xanthobacter TaxID=279 RepID=UPI00372D613D
MDFGRDNLRVNAVLPGTIQTPMIGDQQQRRTANYETGTRHASLLGGPGLG